MAMNDGTVHPEDLAELRRKVHPLLATPPRRRFSCPFCRQVLEQRDAWGPHLDGSCRRQLCDPAT